MPSVQTGATPALTGGTLVARRALAIGAGALGMALAARAALSPPGTPVPVTLQDLAAIVLGGALGPLAGTGAVLLYLALGAAGLPVFAAGGGPAYLLGPTAGYLLAFPLAALLIGALARVVLRRTEGRSGLRWVLLLLAGLAGSFAFVHPMGIAGIALNAGLPLDKAFLADLVYWPGDVIKNIAASAVAVAVHRAFPGLLVHPAVERAQAQEPVPAR